MDLHRIAVEQYHTPISANEYVLGIEVSNNVSLVMDGFNRCGEISSDDNEEVPTKIWMGHLALYWTVDLVNREAINNSLHQKADRLP